MRTKAELEELVKELYLKIGISGKIEKKPLEEMLYREALTLAWKRFGYPEVLADCRTRFLCTDEVSDMEYLAEEVRSYLVHKQWQEKPGNFLAISAESRARQRKLSKIISKLWSICSIHILRRNLPESSCEIFTMAAKEVRFCKEIRCIGISGCLAG